MSDYTHALEAAARLANNGSVAAYAEMVATPRTAPYNHTYGDVMEAVGKALAELESQVRALPVPSSPSSDAALLSRAMAMLGEARGYVAIGSASGTPGEVALRRDILARIDSLLTASPSRGDETGGAK